jgi:hypothetical protein
MFVFNQAHTYSTENNSIFILDAWNINVIFHGTVQLACSALYSEFYTALKTELQQVGNMHFQCLNCTHQVCEILILQ